MLSIRTIVASPLIFQIQTILTWDVDFETRIAHFWCPFKGGWKDEHPLPKVEYELVPWRLPSKINLVHDVSAIIIVDWSYKP